MTFADTALLAVFLAISVYSLAATLQLQSGVKPLPCLGCPGHAVGRQ